MAGESGRAVRPLIERLETEPQRFESQQAVRILETVRRDYTERERQAGRQPADGEDGAVEFRGALSFAFPRSDIESVTLSPRFRYDGGGPRPVMTVNFMALGGVLGPLPSPYTEFVIDSARKVPKITAPLDFLNLFNHRLIFMAMESAKPFRPALQAPDPAQSSHARFLKAIIGLGTPDLQSVLQLRTGVDFTPALLNLAALIHQKPVSAHAVERALSAHFGLGAELIPFQGVWLELPADQWTVLGKRGSNRRLGTETIVGTRVWDQAAGVAIALGPVDFARVFDFLPGGRACAELSALLEVMLGGAFDIRVQLKVNPKTVPASRIGVARRLGRTARLERRGHPAATFLRRAPSTMRLGWTSWLGRRAPTGGRPVASFRLPPMAHAGPAPS